MEVSRSQVRQALTVFIVLVGIGGGSGVLIVELIEQFSGARKTLLIGGTVLLQLGAGVLFLRITRLDDAWAYAFLTGLGAGILSGISGVFGWPSSVVRALAVGLLAIILFSGTIDPILDPVRQ
jgi:FtsH-binding integral membrane protein